MFLPPTLRGKVSGQAKAESNAEEIAREIANFLHEAGLGEVVLAPDAVRFRNTAILIWSFRPYVMANAGAFFIKSDGGRATVSYEIFVTRLLVVSLVLIALLGLAVAPAGKLGPMEKVLILFTFWFWLFAGNCALIWVRTRALVRCAFRNVVIKIGAADTL